jgi:hypothetical protein
MSSISTTKLNIEVGFNDLVKFIETKTSDLESLKKQIATDTEIVEVEIKKLQKSFKDVQDEIEVNYRASVKAWRLSLKMYGDFVKKNPSSNLMKRPDAMPVKPSQVEDIKSYTRLFDSLTQEKIKLKISFLKELFNLTSKAVEASYTTRNYWVNATTGSALALSSNLYFDSSNTSNMPLTL